MKTILAVIALVFSFSSSHAYSVYCSNCSNFWTQMLESGDLVAQLKELENTYDNLQNNLAIAERNITKLSDAGEDFKRIEELFNRDASKGLIEIYRTFKKDGELSQVFTNALDSVRELNPGYESYLRRNAPPGHFQSLNQNWYERGRRNAAKSRALVDANRKSIETEGQVIRKLQKASRSSDGQLAAIQAGNELVSAQMLQNQRMQELMHEQIDQQRQYYEVLQEQAESEQARRDDYFNQAPGRTDYETYVDRLLPSWADDDDK